MDRRAFISNSAVQYLSAMIYRGSLSGPAATTMSTFIRTISSAMAAALIAQEALNG